jgi:hypothetical protein
MDFHKFRYGVTKISYHILMLIKNHTTIIGTLLEDLLIQVTGWGIPRYLGYHYYIGYMVCTVTMAAWRISSQPRNLVVESSVMES